MNWNWWTNGRRQSWRWRSGSCTQSGKFELACLRPIKGNHVGKIHRPVPMWFPFCGQGQTKRFVPVFKHLPGLFVQKLRRFPIGSLAAGPYQFAQQKNGCNDEMRKCHKHDDIKDGIIHKDNFGSKFGHCGCFLCDYCQVAAHWPQAVRLRTPDFQVRTVFKKAFFYKTLIIKYKCGWHGH